MVCSFPSFFYDSSRCNCDKQPKQTIWFSLHGGPWHQRWEALESVVQVVGHALDILSNRLVESVGVARRAHEEARHNASVRMYESMALIGGTIVGCCKRLEAIHPAPNLAPGHPIPAVAVLACVFFYRKLEKGGNHLISSSFRIPFSSMRSASRWLPLGHKAFRDHR